MLRIILFNIFYLGSSGFALVRGGVPERLAAVILVADFQLSHWVIKPLALRYSGVEGTMLAVDLAAFVALYAMSLFSTRYWPMWMAVFQGCAVAGHVNGLRADVIPFAYGNYVAVWSYLLLAILIAGTMRHCRRKRRYGRDPSWRWELPDTYRDGGPADAADISASPTSIFGHEEKPVTGEQG
ncbi:hypothetical protein SAMN05518849_1326 [Sphingobium sp. AP50]|uniref:hypothetical protein n=1 Tax=Sphingobium sp. AP50 TaxID=1884369 RepID=UPI0008D1527C|nr:hypothetical protein [Sphingobium sp. AP50]SEK03966.1 hypothetical protein SAMN05518849_1326 [Sphingobium sp. AP50]